MKKLLVRSLILSVVILCFNVLSVEATNGVLSAADFSAIVENIKKRVLDPDVISLGVWKAFADDIQKVETQGSTEQKAILEKLLVDAENKKSLDQKLTSLVRAVLASQRVRQVAVKVGQAVFLAVLPVIAFETLVALTSGQTDTDRAIEGSLTGAVAAALELLVITLQQVPLEGAIPQGVYRTEAELVQEAGRSLRRGQLPFISVGGTAKKIVINAAQEALSRVIEDEGGLIGLAQKLQWVGPVEPEPAAQTLVEQQAPLFNSMVKLLENTFSNRTAREYLAAITLSAVEGALYAMVLNSLSLGYAGEVATATIVASAALRGAIGGLVNYALYKNIDVGILSQYVSTGIIGRSFQQYLMHGADVSASALQLIKDLPSGVVAAFVVSASNQFVVKSGGWSNAVKTVIGSLARVRWLGYKPKQPTQTSP